MNIPIIFQVLITLFDDALIADNITDGHPEKLYEVNDKISMQLFYFPRKIKIEKVTKFTNEDNTKKKITCNGCRNAMVQNECAPCVRNVPIITARPCLPFSGIS